MTRADTGIVELEWKGRRYRLMVHEGDILEVLTDKVTLARSDRKDYGEITIGNHKTISAILTKLLPYVARYNEWVGGIRWRRKLARKLARARR